MHRPEMLLQTGPKVKSKIVFTEKERVKRSPYYLCNQLWDGLDSDVQRSNTLVEFSAKLRNIDVQQL